jgi:pimeloyl-ACP methyl ester carboxylesterase
MTTKRPRGLIGVGWACLDSAIQGRTEHRPTAMDYPDSVMKRVTFTAGGGLGWRLSALTTPRASLSRWKVVVITGAPSWAEYWAPVLAAAPTDWEMTVVDRPGYGASEPAVCIPDLSLQATALSPLMATAPGQRLLLVGQSYGAGIAALMAAERTTPVDSLVLLSSYLSTPGPTTKWLLQAANPLLDVLPRDLRNAFTEIRGQSEQLPRLREALKGIRTPLHILHGDKDDFAPVGSAQAFFEALPGRDKARFERLTGAGHFLNDGPTEPVIDALRRCLPADPIVVPRRGRDWRQVLAALGRWIPAIGGHGGRAAAAPS